MPTCVSSDRVFQLTARRDHLRRLVRSDRAIGDGRRAREDAKELESVCRLLASATMAGRIARRGA